MSYRGDGYPVLVVDGTANSFPYPVKDSREERLLEEESRIVVRRNGERVHLGRRWRFEARYEWANLTEAQIELLITWRDSWPRVAVTVRPHHDVTTLQVPCWIDELDTPAGVAGVTAYRASVVFRGVGEFTGSMIPDTSAMAATWDDIIAHTA